MLEDLIAELRQQGATVLFSTHTMQHAERLCDRFVMIKSGHKVFEGTIDEARNAYERRLILTTPDDPMMLSGTAGIQLVQKIGADRYALHTEGEPDLKLILKEVVARDIEVISFGREDVSLHDIFFHFAGAAKEKAA